MEIDAHLGAYLLHHVGVVLNDGNGDVVEGGRAEGGEWRGDGGGFRFQGGGLRAVGFAQLVGAVGVGIGGKGEREARRGGIGRRCIAERAVVHLGHLLGSIESDAHATLTGQSLHKGLEQSFLPLRTNARAGVGYLDGDKRVEG